MAVQKMNVGTNDDGTPRFHYHAPDGHVVLTGPLTGTVALPDGSEVDVTEPVIVADSLEHAQAIASAIDARTGGTAEPTTSKTARKG